MKLPKAFSLIIQMRKRERLKFSLYLNSPFFSLETKVKTIGQFICESSNDHSHWDAEEIWSTLFEDDYKPAYFRQLCSKLYKALEDFNAHILIQERSTIRDYLAYERLINLQAGSHKKSLSNKLNLSIEKAKKTDSNLLLLYGLHQLAYLDKNNELKRLNRKANQLEDIQELDNKLNEFFVTEKLKLITRVLAWKGFIERSVSLWGSEMSLSFAEKHEGEKNEILKIYHFVYLTLVEPNEAKHYYELKQLVFNSFHLFEKRQKKDLLDTIINYCVIKINNGNQNFLQELLNNYQQGLKEGIFLVEGQMSPWTFKNIAGVALRLKKFKWTASFIDEFGQNLPPEYRDSSIALARAQLNFYLGNYSEVLELLQEVEFKEFSYNTTSKSLLLASYYELDEYVLLEDLSKSFSKYLSRHRSMSAARKSHFQNLIKYTLGLTKLSTSDSKRLRSLKKSIEETKGLASKAWLLEKVDELLGEPTASSK